MQIGSRATIEDVPLTVIRTLFRRAGLEGALTAGFVRDTLHVMSFQRWLFHRSCAEGIMKL